MIIRNKNDLRAAYELLSYHKQAIAGGPAWMHLDRIWHLKKDIRQYTNKPVKDEVLVKDYGSDGYVVKINLPEWIETKDEANEYMEECEVVRYRPSMYDCTGQIFTSWYKVFNTNGRWRAYHSFSVDV